jgi:Fic family protein
VRKSELHPTLQASAVPVQGHSGCYAVVPPALELFGIDSPLLPMALREMQILEDAVSAAPHYAPLLLHMLNRREAVDSSQIEGTHTAFDTLLLHEIEAGTSEATVDPDADQTLAYLKAYTLGANRVTAEGTRALDLPLICALHGQLMAGNPRSVPGKVRTVQNFIGGLKIEHARFIPAPPGAVPRLMNELDPLIRYVPSPESPHYFGILGRALAAHAQFEAIHPFVDGNGRVGRILIPLMLLGEGAQPLHLATFLKLRKHAYYDALLEVQMKLRWAAWIELFLECTIASCRHTVHLLRELQRIKERWHERLTARPTRKHATVWDLVDLILGQPMVTVNMLIERLKVTFPAANAAVALLVEMDILRPHGDKRRNRAFQAHEVLNLLYTGIDSVLDDVATLTNYGPGDHKQRPVARARR